MGITGHITKRISLLLAIVMIMASAFTVQVFAGDGYTPAMISGSVVNLRSGPSTDHDVMGKFVFGDTVYTAGASNGWVKVKHYDGYGYVCADYVDYSFSAKRSSDSSKGGEIVSYAKKFMGTPYAYGGCSPSGFDCSGFVKYVYSQFGYGLNRTASAQLSNGSAVSKSDLQPGDIVGFYTSSRSTITHVGIYIGDGQFIHSPSPGKSVCVTSINSSYYGPRYGGATRIV